MKYRVDFDKQAKQHIAYLLKSEPAAYKKLERLLIELEEHPRTGTGKPEALKHELSGCWSRRITQRHRLVYIIDDDRIVVLVLAAVGHYD